MREIARLRHLHTIPLPPFQIGLDVAHCVAPGEEIPNRVLLHRPNEKDSAVRIDIDWKRELATRDFAVPDYLGLFPDRVNQKIVHSISKIIYDAVKHVRVRRRLAPQDTADLRFCRSPR